MTRTLVTEADRIPLRAYVASKHPGAQLEFDEEGYDHTMVIADRSHVYRFPRTNFYRGRLTAETAFLRAFASRSPLEVPFPEYRQTPVPHSVYRFISGEQLERDRFQLYSAAARVEAAKLLGEFLTALHAFPVDEARAIGIEDERWWGEHPADRTWFDDEVAPLLPPEMRDCALRALEQEQSLLATACTSVVLHNDVAGEHILHDGQGPTAVIDFGDIAIGDPALDFRFGWEFGEDFVREVEANYGGTRDAGFGARRHAYDAIGILRNLPKTHAKDPTEVPRILDDLARHLTLLEGEL